MDTDRLNFRSNHRALTLGVEIELQVMDRITNRLTPRAPELLSQLKNLRIEKEMFRSTLEIITGVCNDVHEVKADLGHTIDLVRQASQPLGICFSSTGTNPVAEYRERLLSASERYHQLLERNQWLIRRMAVYGMHVHIGMKGPEECIQFFQFFLRFVPHLIALSASSPYWRSYDTGLAAARPTMYEAHPTSGIPYLLKNWADFERVYNAMKQTASIESTKDIWWDIRPSPGYGTLELRMCDMPATMQELTAIVAFVHVLAAWFEVNGKTFFESHATLPDRWILRENKWRAIRYGCRAELINPDTLEVTPFASILERWVQMMQPQVSYFGYEAEMKNLLLIAEKGTSSDRQRSVVESQVHLSHSEKSAELSADSLRAVVRHNINEFESGRPIYY